jgi:dephospho-CoA kinase
LKKARPEKHGLFLLGVTGGLGSGKSTAAELLRRRGARVFDADAIVHELYRQPEVKQSILERMSAQILDAEGRVDRKKLGEIVFRDPVRRRALEDLVHPLVRARIESGIAELRRKIFRGIVVVDAPLLVETRHPYPLDALLLVKASTETRLGRLEKKGMSREEARRRMRAQAEDAEKERKADFVVQNDGSIEELAAQIDLVLEALGRDTRNLLG